MARARPSGARPGQPPPAALAPARVQARRVGVPHGRHVRLVLARTASAVLALLLLAEPSAGQAAAPLSVQAVEYKSDDIEIPAVLAVPRSGGPHPGVIFVHG